MTHTQLERAISFIAPILDEADEEWCIFSSAAAYLMGLQDRLPSDIDIMLSTDGAIRAEALLSPYRLYELPPESGKYRSRRSLYRIEDVEVDISGHLEQLVQGQWTDVNHLPSFRRTTKQIAGHTCRLALL